MKKKAMLTFIKSCNKKDVGEGEKIYILMQIMQNILILYWVIVNIELESRRMIYSLFFK